MGRVRGRFPRWVGEDGAYVDRVEGVDGGRVEEASGHDAGHLDHHLDTRGIRDKREHLDAQSGLGIVEEGSERDDVE